MDSKRLEMQNAWIDFKNETKKSGFLDVLKNDSEKKAILQSMETAFKSGYVRGYGSGFEDATIKAVTKMEGAQNGKEIPTNI